ncbi:Arginyl-tRNA synthetase [Chitinispirillum alkaliphilum]|nr:Arginyl-tRNA synthetase [Chitinispirillum alkaliphilum]
MKTEIIRALAKSLEEAIPETDIERLIEIPPSEEMGDYAFPCFSLARVMKKNPAMISTELGEKVAKTLDGVEVKSVSGYLNFFIDKKKLVSSVMDSARKDDFGKPGTKEKIVIEFSSPNTNKPLHLGHLRNMSIGNSVSRILDFCGNDIVRTSINNDRGVHICKSMLAYQRLGKGETPQKIGKKPDHFVGDYYVAFNKESSKEPSWSEDAQEMLRNWENGDPEIVDLWKKMNTWAFDGFKETYQRFGIEFDTEYYESDIYKNGKEIVMEGLNKGLFSRRDDNAIYADLSEYNLGEKVLLRPDGTSVYIVQDLYLALLKDEQFNYDKSIYVVGNEQDHHFSVLKAIFKKLGFSIAEKIIHLSYGMVELPEGKMKSREGTVVDADDLITETQELARNELVKRYELSESELSDRSLKIALAAIKYQLLKVDITKNMVFDPKKAISFEGDTGPYLLYSYARSSSILRKKSAPQGFEIGQPEPSEIKLAKKISLFPTAVAYAAQKMSPTVIAGFAFELAQSFNEFYHNCQVINSESEAFRLNLVSLFRSTLSKSLDMLGIEKIEEM